MSKEELYDRTFGIEFEYADVDKSNVVLPQGFTWNGEEFITLTTGKRATASARYGGEINTPPLEMKEDSVRKLSDMLSSVKECGARCTWATSIHVHIFVGDLDIEEIKRMYYLSYYACEYIKRYCNFGAWNEIPSLIPSPTINYVNALRDKDSIEGMFTVFVNNLNKGYVRHLVNIGSVMRRGTVEFRCFNASLDIDEVMAAVEFAYRYVNYARNHSEDDFRSIDSYDKFLSELCLSGVTPQVKYPMIFAGDQNHPTESFISKNVGFNTKLLSCIVDNTPEEIAMVNPDIYSMELCLYKKKKLTIYCNDEFCDIMYRIGTGSLKVHYKNDFFSFIEAYNNDTPVRQLSCFLLFHRLHKYNQESVFYKREFDAIMSKMDDNVVKFDAAAEKLIDMFSNVTYKRGTLLDAIAEEDAIVYQLDNNSKLRSTAFLLEKHSDYIKGYTRQEISYYDIVETLPEGKLFMMISACQYLPMTAIAKSNKLILYSNMTKDGKLNRKYSEEEPFSVITPPDDLAIDDISKLRIMKATPTSFSYLQKAYIVKVAKITPPRFPYLVYYDKYCLGGFGFDYDKKHVYPLVLLSDFSTNNKVPKLSKFILFCLKSDLVKHSIEVQFRGIVDKICTKAYTDKPVSMKYRGPFKKVDMEEKKNYLLYETELGTIPYNELIQTYQKAIKQ